MSATERVHQGLSTVHEAPAGPPAAGVVVLCEYFPPAGRAGGPLRSIPAIIRSEMETTRIRVLTRGRDFGVRTPFTADQVRRADQELPAVAVHRFRGIGQPFALWRRLRRELGHGDLLYVNSVMSPLYSIWPLVLMRCRAIRRCRVLLTPRGELAAVALATKSTKKRAAVPIIRRVLSGLDIVWQATSAREVGEIRRFIGELPQPVVVRGHPPPPPQRVRFPANASITVVFVGRMVPGKNFRVLAEALGRVAFDVRVVVAGILEDQAYWRGCQRALARVGRHVDVVTLGHVEHDEIMNVLREADALVLPTRGESFGHAIAEALSIGCPVLIPDTTMWTDIVRRGGGRVIDCDDPAPLVDALQFLHEQSPAERRAARTKAGRLYAAWWEADQRRDSLFGQALAAPAPR